MKKLLCFMALALSFCASANNSIQKLYQSVNDSVVELHVKALAEPKPGQVRFKVSTADSLGSGAVISKEGRILTAAHVVDKATDIEVIFNDGTKTSGHVVWVDSLIDLAMIQAYKVPSSVKPLKLAKPGDYEVGEQIIVIGAPFGVSHSLSVGYLSGIRDKEKVPGTELKPRFLQTDAAINQGNSGGPMFNLEGEIIGIVSHILSSSGGSNGLGFSVSTDTIHTLMENAPSVFFGAIPHMLSKDEALALNNPYGHGALIQQVVPNTLADRLGFKGGFVNVMVGRTPVLLGGDIILEIASIPLKDVKSAIEIRNRFKEYSKGDKVIFKYLRNGKMEKTFWEVD
ncbi:S1C family serine protease [Thalassotalea euphylliae]|uniref:S1C family serine protease n=1 Tax=Thalassotalea euphylliae TaxID=1655234 RepID=UPI00362908AA